ncbi:MAG TPA: MFS transporter [Candidatus Acidoferrales bacterium]|jgi:MFS family permease|nr:MFS transporter [Candidatus Acidoferrales bacterium]
MAIADTPISPLPAPENRSRFHDLVRSLRHRNFQLFFSGQLISLIGTWMQNIAQAWLVYRLTGSSLLLGIVGFAGQIPIFLFAPIGGLAADRWNRHHVVIGTQVSSMILAFILAALTLFHVVQVWEIVVLAALLGVVNAFDVPARQSFLIEMVVREDLMNAIALNSSMFNGARVIGPAIAGILVARIGEGWCFFANAVSYIAVIIGLLMMKLGPLRTASKDSSPFEHIAEGFRFVRRTKPILALVLLIGLVSLVAVPYSVLMPIFADRVLHSGAHGLGILMGATGIGALLGALTLAIRRGVQGLGRVVGLSAAGFGVSLILFAFSRSLWLSVALLVPVGYGVMLQMSSSNTLIQAMVPDELRGRAMAMYTMMFMGMAPVGSLFAGALADKIGAPWTVAIGGLGAIAGAAVFLRRLPSLRFEAQQLIVAQGLSPAEPSKEIAAH